MNHSEQLERLVFTETPRASHLYRLWQNLAASRELPQVDRWLAQYFRAEKRFGKKDRQWYADAIFAAFRMGPAVILAEKSFAQARSFADILAEIQASPSLWTALREIDAARLFFWLSLYRSPCDRFPAESQFLAELPAKTQSEPLAQLMGMGIPAFYAESLRRRAELSAWDESTRNQFLKLQSQKAPLWLRVNHRHKADAARQELLAAGAQIQESDDAWHVETTKNIQQLRCIDEGALEIQDLASQRIGAALNLANDPLVWDCCAGGGGKTMQIASQLKGKGLVFASDIRNYKLAEVERRALRAGFSRVRTLPWNGENLPTFPAEWNRQGGVDIILIDAPCTGTGTWRRSPDSKYRWDARSLVDLQKLQKSLFSKVLPALKKGGQLIYATCSWLPEENEDIIAAALQEHPQLQLVRMQLCGNPVENSDTMFFAILRKQS